VPDELSIVSGMPKEHFDLLMIIWWFQVENNLDLGHVDFNSIFAYDVAQQNSYRRGKDAFLNVQRQVNLSASLQHHS
jgi:hypothetical protein